MPLLEVSALTKLYAPGQGVEALNLTLEKEVTYALLGPSGSGKTTLLRLIAGLETPQRGKILLRGKLANDPEVRVPPEKRGIGMVFQNLALWPHLTALENLTFGLHRVPRRERLAKARERLAAMGLDHRQRAYPNELSGGERQRVALARALIHQPDFLLLDEPLANLDSPLKKALIQEIRLIQQKEGVTILLVTHDREDAFAVAARILVMHGGRIVQEGTPDQVYRHPCSPLVAHFLGPAGLLRVDFRDGTTAVSVLGSFHYPNLKANGEVVLLLRPEDLQICGSANGVKAMVLGGHYEAGRWQWQVEVGGNILPLWAESSPRVGESVSVEAVRAPTPLALDDGHG
jgi:iron(III) transport system ATP-binding protein